MIVGQMVNIRIVCRREWPSSVPPGPAWAQGWTSENGAEAAYLLSAGWRSRGCDRKGEYESHESGCGILSNLAIHVWDELLLCCNENGRKESSREAQLPVGVYDVLLAPGVGFSSPVQNSSGYASQSDTVECGVITERVCAASSNRIASKRVWSRTACECQAKGMRNQCRSGVVVVE
jgi:hypothetical protein